MAAMKRIEDESEKYWNSLTKEQQLDVFCAVVRRIYDGEVDHPRSYRGVLYDIFGFGPEAYAQAQMAGYLTLHNLIMGENHDYNLLKVFCDKNNIEMSEEKIRDFLA